MKAKTWLMPLVTVGMSILSCHKEEDPNDPDPGKTHEIPVRAKRLSYPQYRHNYPRT